jgi:Domain of unknown function (DUF4129)
MSRRHRRRRGPGPLELIEEAVHLLRLSPWAVLSDYYLGSLPFVLGLLYFWADMSRGSMAYEHCAPAALAVSLLFLWMKTWQAIFARHLKARITGRSAPTMTLSAFFRTAMNQTILQPSGLFLLPLSLLLVLPFGWLYAFYQSVTAFCAEDAVAAKHVFQRAARQAQLWPRQNHVLLGALLLFGLVVFLDVAMGLATVPSLLKILFGVETAFTRSLWGLLNTTFVATVGALTYLCLDPLVKAVYLLRCFYGESVHTGEDLRAELKQFAPGAGAAAMVLLLVILVLQGLAGTRGEAINGTLARSPALRLPVGGQVSPGKSWYRGRLVCVGRPPFCCPEGTIENSPAFQRWAGRQKIASPEGMAEVRSHAEFFSRPFGTCVPCGMFPGVKTPGYSQDVPPGQRNASAAFSAEKATRFISHAFNGISRPWCSARRMWDTFRLRRAAVGADQTASAIPNSELRTPNSGISPPDLDRSIEQVLGRREFNWRLPREKPADVNSDKGFLAAFMDGLIETLRSWAKAIGRAVKAVVRWVADVIDWLREKIFGNRPTAHESGSAGTDWMVSLQGLISVLLVLTVCAVAILFYRTWRRRGARKEIASEAVAPVPDLADENVTASQLPEDDWLRLARELMGKGELRLALRALYLAGLAHLAQRDMIRVAKFKSNRDYEQELSRRARALPELQAAFAENVGIFDRVWYGLHEVTHEALQRFQNNLEKIKAS